MRHSSFDPDVNGQAWTEEMGVRTARPRGTAIARGWAHHHHRLRRPIFRPSARNER